MITITMVVGVVVVAGCGLLVTIFVDDRYFIVLSGGSSVISGVAFMMCSSVDVIWWSAMSASVSLPPATIVAFVAKSDPWSYVVPKGHGWVGLPVFIATKAQRGGVVPKVTRSRSLATVSFLPFGVIISGASIAGVSLWSV